MASVLRFPVLRRSFSLSAPLRKHPQRKPKQKPQGANDNNDDESQKDGSKTICFLRLSHVRKIGLNQFGYRLDHPAKLEKAVYSPIDLLYQEKRRGWECNLFRLTAKLAWSIAFAGAFADGNRRIANKSAEKMLRINGWRLKSDNAVEKQLELTYKRFFERMKRDQVPNVEELGRIYKKYSVEDEQRNEEEQRIWKHSEKHSY